MKFLLGIVFAVLMHASVIAFGGLLFPRAKENKGTLQEVELLTEDTSAEEKKKEEEQPAEKKEELEVESEEVPDSAEIIRSLELSAAASAPELESVSLSAIELALSGVGGSDDFGGDVVTFNSGGRIGGKGKAGALDESLEKSFDLTEIDQKPQAIFRVSPLYPSEMRGKKLEGVVTIIFVVDPAGKVASPRVEKSTHTAFEKPALDALKQWKFEPGLKGGQRVNCKMRQSLRFQPN